MANDSHTDAPRWYHGITAYQWFVLFVASAGWVFDIYEGQIFNITRKSLLTEILAASDDDPAVKYFGDVLVAVFLVGGAFGGVLFGWLADRWGRLPMLSATILMYSLFSGLTYFAEEMWQVAVLRFLVAMGTGGEWSVGAALVAETFPVVARAHAGSIFHASSVLGTWLATLAALAVGSEWRYAYLLGVLPAVLIFLVRARMHEPEAWQQRRTAAAPGQVGGLRELFRTPEWRRRAVLGLLLAATGLGTFWAVTIAGQDLARARLLADGVSPAQAEGKAQFAYGIVATAGGGVGLLAFGPLSVRFGRRRTFIAFQLATLVIVPITCYAPTEYRQLLALLPVYGFFTLGIHAGFAVYFPELFPTRLRATGAGLCFNGGRLATALVMILSAWLKARPGVALPDAVTLLSGLALLGILLILAMPETKGAELPE